MQRTAGEIANFIGAQLEGDANAIVAGIASPENAGPGDLIYVDSERFLENALASSARVVISLPGIRIAGKTMILAAQPKLAFAKAAAWLFPPSVIASGIHPTAVIDPSAKLAASISVGPYAVIEAKAQIGSHSQIGAHCFVGAGAVMGESCRLYPRVTLYSGAKLGNRVTAHSGAVIGSDGFGFVFDGGRFLPFPQAGQVQIADDVEIGANSTIDRGSLSETRIGKGTKLDNLVHVAHNVQIGEHTVVAAQTGISGSSMVGKNVLVGGQVGIADHCQIEDGAVLGAQAGIPTGKKIRAGQTVWGTPARPIEKFKKQYAWYARLPELAERIRKLEGKA